jgi:Tfp pilus assembly protein PilX
MSQHLKNREGFALPMVIVVIAVLTAALAASFSSTNAEITTNSAERGQNRAFDIAEAGLEQFMVSRSQSGWCDHCVSDPSTVDSEYTRVKFTTGYADVVARRIRPVIGASNAMFFIRSKGVDTTLSGRLNAAAGTVYAERTVGQYATWMTTTMNVQAAWLSLSGLVKNGSGTISGVDQCGAKSNVAGVTVPKGDLSIKGGSFSPTGSPPVDTTETTAQLQAATPIDWAGILNGGIDADITIPGGSFPSAATFAADTTYWPVIRIHSNYSLPNQGRGMIIADSDFTISGSNMWDGIILVGGQLTSNGNNTTSGATVSGLNLLVGGRADTSSVNGNVVDSTSVSDATANGTKAYVYNSCNVAKATSKLQHYSAIPNSWVDNLASW